MFWWFNVFAPQTHWPLSGGVTQDIRPELFARAGSEDIERRALREVASYGRQIGALSDLLLSLADQPGIEKKLGDKGAKALAQLRDWSEKIDALKPGAEPPVPDDAEAARALMAAIVKRHPGLNRR